MCGAGGVAGHARGRPWRYIHPVFWNSNLDCKASWHQSIALYFWASRRTTTARNKGCDSAPGALLRLCVHYIRRVFHAVTMILMFSVRHYNKSSAREAAQRRVFIVVATTSVLTNETIITINIVSISVMQRWRGTAPQWRKEAARQVNATQAI